MNTTHPQKPTPKVPTSLLEGWLPSLPAKLKPCFLARGAGVFVVKFRLPCPPNRRQLSSLSAALQNLLPRSIGQESFDSRQLFVNPVRNTALLTFWFPTGGSNEATFVATLNNYPATGFYSPGKVTAKPLPRGFAGNISGDYAEAVVEDFPHDAEPVASDRQLIKRARQAISHIFPGIVRIVLDPRAGTLKTSFENTKLFNILKHRELYVRVLNKHGFQVNEGDQSFKVGTWRYDAGKDKKNIYHVLTLEIPTSEARGVLCTFKPVWKRKIRPKTEEEIDKELNEVLGNREALIKRLKIKTTTQNTNA